jgi:glycosyltransferase involved in cell wall biosynthesis
MKISFGITVHNEDESLKKLLRQLTTHKQVVGDCEIVVVDDFSDNIETLKILDDNKEHIRLFKNSLNKNFSQQKNFLNSKCLGKYVFQIDSDELVNDVFLNNINVVLDSNPNVDLFMVPRVNRLVGLTAEHIVRWGWRPTVLDGLIETRSNLSEEEYRLLKANGLILNEDGELVTFRSILINWPDYQFRLYRNSSEIKWERELHEFIIGAEIVAHLPHDDYTWALFHDKSIERQESQNKFYISNFSDELNFRK